MCDKSETTAEFGVVRGTYVSPVDVAPENSPSDVTGRPFLVGLRATLEKIGIPQGKNKHNQNFGAIFFCMPFFLEGDPEKS